MFLSGGPSAKKVHTQMLTTCINRTMQQWTEDSAQHRSRLEALVTMLIESACSVRLVDQPAFRDFVRTLDPKFKMPG